MKQTQRVLYEIVALLMAIFFVIPFGVLVAAVFSLSVWCALIPCIAVLGHIAGRATFDSEVNIAMIACVASAVVSLVGAALLIHSLSLAGVVIALLSLVLCVYLFFAGRKAGFSLYTAFALTGILAQLAILIICTMLSVEGAASNLLIFSACAFFLLSLYSFNNNSLRASMHKGTAARNVHYPSGMKINNFWLLTVFIIVAAIISNIAPLAQGFGQLLVLAIKAIASFLGMFSGFFDRRVVVTGEDEESTSTVADEDNIFAYDAKGEASLVTTIVEIIAFIIVAIMLAYLLLRLWKYLKKHLFGKGTVFTRFRNMFTAPEAEDYMDETEDLLSMKDILANAGNAARERLRKMRERPQRFDDFQDDGMKIRFVYQQLLKTFRYKIPTCTCKTPNEMMEQALGDDEDVSDFIAAYNDVRYADEQPSSDQVAAARRVLKRKFQ